MDKHRLEVIIRYHQDMLDEHGLYISSAAKILEKETIAALKELKTIQDKNENA